MAYLLRERKMRPLTILLPRLYPDDKHAEQKGARLGAVVAREVVTAAAPLNRAARRGSIASDPAMPGHVLVHLFEIPVI
jgi:hypothetical protein